MMEEIFNWVMLGWLLNVGMFILLVILISIKVLTKDDPIIFQINSEIYIQRVKPMPKLQNLEKGWNCKLRTNLGQGIIIKAC